MARAPVHASASRTPSTPRTTRSSKAGSCASLRRNEKSNSLPRNVSAVAPSTEARRLFAPRYTAPPLARASNVRTRRCRRRNALRSESRIGRERPVIRNESAPGSAADEMPTSRKASLTLMRQPCQTGTAAASTGMRTPTTTCRATTHAGMWYAVTSKLSRSPLSTAYALPPTIATGSASATAMTPSIAAMARYIAASCGQSAPMVFITPICRTCPASSAAMRLTTRKALSRSAIAANAPCVYSSEFICAACGWSPGTGTSTSVTTRPLASRSCLTAKAMRRTSSCPSERSRTTICS